DQRRRLGARRPDRAVRRLQALRFRPRMGRGRPDRLHRDEVGQLPRDVRPGPARAPRRIGVRIVEGPGFNLGLLALGRPRYLTGWTSGDTLAAGGTAAP